LLLLVWPAYHEIERNVIIANIGKGSINLKYSAPSHRKTGLHSKFMTFRHTGPQHGGSPRILSTPVES
jgi:hypothetical protein